MGSGIHYSKEFKIEAVRRVIESSRTYSDVANELSLHKDTLRKWVREVKEHRLEDDTSSATDDKKELRDAKREIKRLKDQVAFLKKAAAFFAADQQPNGGSPDVCVGGSGGLNGGRVGAGDGGGATRQVDG